MCATRHRPFWHFHRCDFINPTLEIASDVRLLDGRRAYLHAIIDNFSRRILTWCVGETFDPAVTATLLLQAVKGLLTDSAPQAYIDGGVENTNSAVTALVKSGTLKRILAQIDVVFSNSMIEASWRMLKHQWCQSNSKWQDSLQGKQGENQISLNDATLVSPNCKLSKSIPCKPIVLNPQLRAVQNHKQSKSSVPMPSISKQD